MKTFTIENDHVLEKYDYLWCLSDDRWAWEYARRSEIVKSYYQKIPSNIVFEKISPYTGRRLLELRSASTFSDKLGIVVFPDPDLNALKADIVWNRAAFPNQAEVSATFLTKGQVCDLWEAADANCQAIHITNRIGQEFVLLSNAGRMVQVRCTGVSLLGLEKLRLKFTISEIAAFDEKVKAQRSVLDILNKDLSDKPVWTKRTQILRNGLIALDGLDAGMSRFQIAELIFGYQKAKAEWNAGSLRHSMRYLIKKAQSLRDGGFYAELLGSQKGVVWA